MKHLLSSVAVALASTSFVAPQPIRGNWTVGQAVKTTSGRVFGHAPSKADQVSAYLGIPYAVPPIGALRFQPPIAYNGSLAINGSDFGPACMQPTPTEFAQSEDCLSINVWTKPQTGERKKAVLVWIHGGAYTYGGARQPMYDGQFITDTSDVVLMSINYRLGIFGFPGDPASAPNLGLLDMRIAMEWVRDNAEAFGGDTSRITIFGQSAGSGMADFYSFAYASDPIASGFILQSATVVGFPALLADTLSPRWYRIADSVGCPSSNSSTAAAAVTDCMRIRTAAQIFAGFSTAETGIGSTPAFGPGVDNELVFEDYSNRSSADAAYLIGNNENEAGAFKSLQPSRTEIYWADFNFRFYTCADNIRLAQTLSAGLPSWRYRYFGDFPNLVLSTNPPSGAYHGAELQPLFGTLPQDPPSTTVELETAKFLRGAWTTFAKNPTSGLLSYSGGWPLYNPSEDTMAHIAFNNQTGTNLGQGDAYNDRCASLPATAPS
ncbi:Cholinesterase [Colletotrichum viniferum]|nr:Cholinesterase [Colletotrichum viniferum]